MYRLGNTTYRTRVKYYSEITPLTDEQKRFCENYNNVAFYKPTSTQIKEPFIFPKFKDCFTTY